MRTFFKTTSILIVAISFIFNSAKSQTKINNSDSLPTGINTYSKVEIEASFPGGPQAWTKYITKYIQNNVDVFRKKDFGTCIVKFIVDKHGHISDVEATTMKKSHLAKIAIEAVESGPKWIPAQQNGKYVNAYRLQPVTLTEPGK